VGAPDRARKPEPCGHQAGDRAKGAVGSELPHSGYWDHTRVVVRRPNASGSTHPHRNPISHETETWANIWAYMTIPTVKEIVIVNSACVEAELLRRNPEGTWPEVPLRIGREDALDLDSIAFSVSLAALYRTTTLATPGETPP
jgi:hypothetical protein